MHSLPSLSTSLYFSFCHSFFPLLSFRACVTVGHHTIYIGVRVPKSYRRRRRHRRRTSHKERKDRVTTTETASDKSDTEANDEASNSILKPLSKCTSDSVTTVRRRVSECKLCMCVLVCVLVCEFHVNGHVSECLCATTFVCMCVCV